MATWKLNGNCMYLTANYNVALDNGKVHGAMCMREITKCNNDCSAIESIRLISEQIACGNSQRKKILRTLFG